jgi:MerR family transcriptional regulator, copper efflux regulator
VLIGELAARTGVPPRTLRFYESQRLLPEPPRTAGGYRDYDPEAADRVAFIRHGLASGLSLRQIGEILAIRDDGHAPCAHATSLIHQRLAEVEHRLAELEATRDQLRQLAERARYVDPDDCLDYCHIIEPVGTG